MGALLESAVTTELGFFQVSSPFQVRTTQVTLVLDTQGGATNTVDASTLGYSKILGSTMAQKSDDALTLITCPSYDGTKLFFYDFSNATDATRDAPVDVTGTFRVLVWGV